MLIFREDWEDENNPSECPVCGHEHPHYIVKDPGHTVLGCEECLTIYREGVIQI